MKFLFLKFSLFLFREEQGPNIREQCKLSLEVSSRAVFAVLDAWSHLLLRSVFHFFKTKIKNERLCTPFHGCTKSTSQAYSTCIVDKYVNSTKLLHGILNSLIYSILITNVHCTRKALPTSCFNCKESQTRVNTLTNFPHKTVLIHL